VARRTTSPRATRELQLLELEKQRRGETVIVITMLDLNRENQRDDYHKLRQAFEGRNAYLYLNSSDRQWHRKDCHGTQSVIGANAASTPGRP